MEFVEHSKLPTHQFASRRFHSFARMGGPTEDRYDTLEDPHGIEIASAKSFSSLPSTGAFADIAISQRYYCSFYGDKSLIALSDGGLCNKSAAEAAERAIDGFVQYMNGVRDAIETTREAAHALQRGFSKAHKFILEGNKDLKACGSAQLLAGLIIKLKSDTEHPWAFVCCSVGHNKAFCLKKDGSIVDVTQNNFLYRSKIPLGRLGPVIEGSYPDLTNLRLYYYPCEEGDTILVGTSQFHANLHPQQAGKNPGNVGLSIKEWKELTSNEKGKETLNRAICDNLQTALAFGKGTTLHEKLTNLSSYIMKFTEEARSAVVANEVSLEDLAEQKYSPAILGHCTVLAVHITDMELMNEKEQEDIKAPAIRTNRQWKWHVLFPLAEAKSPEFDIFKYLISKNSEMKEILDKQTATDFEECIINLNDAGIKLTQKTPLVMEVHVRSKDVKISRELQDLSIEKWEFAGEVDLKGNRPKNKNKLGESFSFLLRRKEVDKRKITAAVHALVHLDTKKDVYMIKGTRKVVEMALFGSAFKILSGDMVLSQCDISMDSFGGESKGRHRFIEIACKKEQCLFNFVSKLEIKDHWITSDFPEFLLPIEDH